MGKQRTRAVTAGEPPAIPRSAPISEKGWIDHAIAHAPRWAKGLIGGWLWGALHKRALSVPHGVEDTEWLAAFRRVLPCGDCRQHWDAMLAKSPPEWADYFGWTVARHNEVNRRLGKPEISRAEALQRWSGALADPLQPPG